MRADDDYEEWIIPPPIPLVVVPLTGGSPGHPATHGLHQPAAVRPPVAGPLPRAPVGGFHASTWASIFHIHPIVLQPLLPWLHQELGQLLEDAQEAAAVQRLIISSLCRFGLVEESLVRVLQTSLGRRTRSFDQQLVDTIVRLCSGEIRCQMDLEDTPAAGERESSPDPAPGPAASHGESPAPSPALQGGSSSPPDTHHSTHGE
ncbi:hypothetical protein AV530_000313 [Patagioenas fasciata monilis]|uniref:Uncharacterized protein n=1 Tax=Patagioenas fasciata monilis TaxID=372326 RepID=A0A1V4KDD2_PATFA|nr:hypothetical protein AV530_000313 [Patagioenas fasciata monilis]